MITPKLMRYIVLFNAISFCSIHYTNNKKNTRTTIITPYSSEKEALKQRKQALSMPYALNQQKIAELDARLQIVEQKIKYQSDTSESQLKAYRAQEAIIIKELNERISQQKKMKEELSAIAAQL